MEKKNPTLEEMVRMRVVYSVAGMDAVASERDRVYKTTGEGPLNCDVYSPAAAGRARPAVILVHGGPLPRTGARKMGVFVSYGELLAASGFVAVTFDHRFLAPSRLAEAGGDVADLVAHVRGNAGALGVDPERVALWAFSGGGPFLSEPLRTRPSWLRALVAYYAALDLQQPAPGADSGLDPALRVAWSPLAALGADGTSAPPVLVARAGLDHPWLNGSIDRFVAQALASGATLDLLTHPSGRHGFDILDDEPRSKAIIRHTLDFLRDCLDP